MASARHHVRDAQHAFTMNRKWPYLQQIMIFIHHDDHNESTVGNRMGRSQFAVPIRQAERILFSRGLQFLPLSTYGFESIERLSEVNSVSSVSYPVNLGYIG